MPTDRPSLLPPGSSDLERDIDRASARVGDVAADLGALWNPATCPIELLPWLAWALSTDIWDPDWSEARKRQEVAVAIAVQRRKGTRGTVADLLARFDELLELTEWWETVPPGPAHTFSVILPIGAGGGDRATAAFARAIVRDVSRVKPARSHFILVQSLQASAEQLIYGGAQLLAFVRHGFVADDDEPDIYLLTEDGEPITDEANVPLEEVG